MQKGNPKGVIQPLKPQYFGYAVNPFLQHTTFLKNAVQTKFYRHVEGTQYEDLYIAAQNDQIDVINFESCEKVGNVLNQKGEFTPVYNEEGKVNVSYSNGIPYLLDEDTLPRQELYTRFFGIQTEVPDVIKDKVVRGTQVTKLIQSNFKHNGSFINKEVELLCNEYDDVLKQMIQLGKESLLEKLGMKKDPVDGSYYTTNLKTLVETLRKEAESRGLPDNQIDSIAIEDFGNYQELVYKLDTLPNRDKMDSIINSIVHSTVISEKMHGKPAVQVASTLFESDSRKFVYLKDGVYTEVSDLTGLSETERKSVRLVSSDLSFYKRGENGASTSSMEVYLSWFFKGIKPEAIGLVYKNGVYSASNIDNRLLQVLGFRIPTQGMNSIDSIVIKGFLPEEMGDMVVVPSEIVGKSGSDFDIDKLQTYLPNYYVKDKQIHYVEWKGSQEETLKYYSDLYDNGEFLSKAQRAELKAILSEKDLGDRLMNSFFAEWMSEKAITTDMLSELKDPAKVKDLVLHKILKQALQNRYREIMQELVLRPENYRQLVVPNGVDTIKGIAKEINKLKGVPDQEKSKVAMRRLITSSDIRERYVSSRRMVGVGALQITSHTMSQLADIELTGEYDAKRLYYLFPNTRGRKINIRLPHNTKEGALTFSSRQDQNNQWISELLSEALSGFVDAAKDPFVFALNINMDTANTWFYLQKLGVPVKHIAYLFNQPIVNEYFKERMKNNSIFKRSAAESETLEDLMLKTISKYLTAAGMDDIYPKVKELKRRIKDLDSIDNYRQKKKQTIQLRREIKQIKAPLYSLVESSRTGTVTLDKMRQAIINGSTPGHKMSKEEAIFQLGILFDYLEYNAQSRFMSDFVIGMGYDNKKTRTIIENRVQQSAWNKVVNQDVPFIKNPENIMNTFIGELKAQKEDMFKVFESFFVSLQPKVQEIFQPAIEFINNTNLNLSRDDKGDFINNYQNFFITYILHTTPFNGDKNETINRSYSMLFGENSIPVQLKKLRDGNDPMITNNKVIRELLPLINNNRKSTDNIRLLSRKMDVLEQNVLIESFTELLDYAKSTNNSELEKFVTSLSVFAIIQSGVSGNRNSFIKILPVSVYSELTKVLLDNFNNSDINLDPKLIWKQFHQNNWWNRDIVPKAEYVYSKSGLAFTFGGSEMAEHEFFVRYFPKYRKGSKEYEYIITHGSKKDLFEPVLYQQVFSLGDNNSGDKVYYRPIPILGNGPLFTEVYLQDGIPSKMNEASTFTEEEIRNAIEALEQEQADDNEINLEAVYELSTKSMPIDQFIMEAQSFIDEFPDKPAEEIIEHLKCL